AGALRGGVRQGVFGRGLCPGAGGTGDAGVAALAGDSAFADTDHGVPAAGGAGSVAEDELAFCASEPTASLLPHISLVAFVGIVRYNPSVASCESIRWKHGQTIPQECGDTRAGTFASQEDRQGVRST